MTPLDLALMFLEKGKEDERGLRALAGHPEVADAFFGFHVQQALEKYLKALLAVGEERPTRTHKLDVLLGEVAGVREDLPITAEEVAPWSNYAVENRYPETAPEPPIDRAAALRLVEKTRAWVEEALGQE